MLAHSNQYSKKEKRNAEMLQCLFFDRIKVKYQFINHLNIYLIIIKYLMNSLKITGFYHLLLITV